MMWTLIIAAVASFALTAAIGPAFIPFLKRLKFGQEIRDEGPKWHMSKSGTPTMGGIMFIISTMIATLVLAVKTNNPVATLIVCLAALSFGFVGFIDDYIKVVKKRNLGLTAKQKMALQLLCTAALLTTLRMNKLIDTKLFIPFANIRIDLGIFFYIFAAFGVVAMVNAVNLTDGIDGLAASVTIPVAITLIIFSLVVTGEQSIALFMSALVGSLFGFLIYNIHPAKVFMGDTGSLFLGGAIAACVFLLKAPILFIFIGFIYTVETLSVSLQVGYFKLTHGKRLFKMSPIHHHFELCGWSESKIVTVFTLVTVIMCIIGYIGFYNIGVTGV